MLDYSHEYCPLIRVKYFYNFIYCIKHNELMFFIVEAEILFIVLLQTKKHVLALSLQLTLNIIIWSVLFIFVELKFYYLLKYGFSMIV